MMNNVLAAVVISLLVLTITSCATRQAPTATKINTPLQDSERTTTETAALPAPSKGQNSATINEETIATEDQDNASALTIKQDITREIAELPANSQTDSELRNKSNSLESDETARSDSSTNDLSHQPLDIQKLQQTGLLENASLVEVSGLASSKSQNGVLFAINDSGNNAELFAMSESGSHLNRWKVAAKNRDWEDLAQTTIDGQSYLVIGDVGDNLGIHRHASLYFIPEPKVNLPSGKELMPTAIIEFTYEDGAKNVEAFAIYGNEVFFITKEPVTTAGTAQSRVYRLSISSLSQASGVQIAEFVTEIPKLNETWETRLAASFAGIDLNHPTALDFDELTMSAYVLTYRQVLKFSKLPNQTWTEAFSAQPKLLTSHRLSQAEALAVSPNRAVFFTTEKSPAPIWALPVRPPL